MNKVFKQLKRILIHKYWVAYYCFQLGLYWQGITHDLSKFSWFEFSRSVKYYDDHTSSINIERQREGYAKTYLHHRGRNPHHYEYWVTNLDKGGIAQKMPKKFVLELICDYLAANKTYSKNVTFNDEYQWWIQYIEQPLKIHGETLKYITTCFRFLAIGGKFKSILKIKY